MHYRMDRPSDMRRRALGFFVVGVLHQVGDDLAAARLGDLQVHDVRALNREGLVRPRLRTLRCMILIKDHWRLI